MRSRTFRQGSVGLLIIFTCILALGGVIWLKRITFSPSSYEIEVNFQDANGLREGAGVFYRGFEVGKVVSVQSGANGIDVTVEITQPDLVIPSDTIIEANQGGLIGDTTLDLVPQTDVDFDSLSMDPMDLKNCDSDLVICNGDRFTGIVGSSFNELVRTTTNLGQVYGEELFAENANDALANTALAAQEIANLSQELARLSSSVRQELSSISISANVFTQVAKEATGELSLTANNFSNTANELSNTAKKYGNTADELTELVSNMNSVVAENRGTLVATLNNISASSSQLQNLMASLTPLVGEFRASFDPQDINNLINNLEILTVNAAEASNNLKEASAQLNDPTNIVMLQQTLDAARVTFANTQKITSDLDDLTGNPQFRNNVLRLVNGLSSLVSSTEDLENQIEVVQVLESQQEALELERANVVLNAEMFNPEVNNIDTQTSIPQNNEESSSVSLPKNEDELILNKQQK